MSGHVPPPLRHVWAHTTLSIKPCLNMTSFGNLLFLFIAMTHAGCGFKLCNVAIISGNVPPLTCSGTFPPSNMFGHVPHPLNMFGHVPPPRTCSGTYLPPSVNQTLSGHYVILQHICVAKWQICVANTSWCHIIPTYISRLLLLT